MTSLHRGLILCQHQRDMGGGWGGGYSELLFTLYTADLSHIIPTPLHCRSSHDSAMVGLITQYRELMQDFVDWCHWNHFWINQDGNILYLEIHLNNKLQGLITQLDCTGRVQSRPCVLRKLRSLGVQGTLLKTFYDSVIASPIIYHVVWMGIVRLHAIKLTCAECDWLWVGRLKAGGFKKECLCFWTSQNVIPVFMETVSLMSKIKQNNTLESYCKREVWLMSVDETRSQLGDGFKRPVADSCAGVFVFIQSTKEWSKYDLTHKINQVFYQTARLARHRGDKRFLFLSEPPAGCTPVG